MDKKDPWEGLLVLMQMLTAQKAVIYSLIDTHPDATALLERFEGYIPTAIEMNEPSTPEERASFAGYLNEWRKAIARN